ncbi:MAG: hypothetical protein COT71_03840, partial [Candidatus Andersenbacteria bacterium CG10_big_fil_rev_8_21_14_0_10_54_11]
MGIWVQTQTITAATPRRNTNPDSYQASFAMLKEITDRRQWNQFLLRIEPNTFLHSWEWGQVQQTAGEAVRYLGFFSASHSQQQTGAALVVTVNARRGRHYLIPHLPAEAVARAGGPSPREFLNELVPYLKSRAKQDGAVALRIAPLLKNTPAHQQVLRSFGFRPAPMHVHAELTWIIDIEKTDAELLAGMRKTTRHAIRKAEQAGVAIDLINDPDEALARFWPLYEQTRARHGFILW